MLIGPTFISYRKRWTNIDLVFGALSRDAADGGPMTSVCLAVLAADPPSAVFQGQPEVQYVQMP